MKSFAALARRKGAAEAKVIDASTVVVGEWVRWKCRFGCGGYGKNLTCPPFSPEPGRTRKVIESYGRALLIRGGENSRVNETAVFLERQMFLDGYYRAFALKAGPCDLCPRCDVENPCLSPEQARPAMESCGIDVFRTVRNNGFRIEVLKSADHGADFFALVLAD